ncbi:MAG: VWA domain-containing protein [Kofleriaceae bacterium]
MNRLHYAFLTAALALGGGCGPKEFGSLCDDPSTAPATCNEACDPLPGAANTCPSGWHCSPDGFCDAQCIPGGSECGEGYECTADGSCVGTGMGSNGPDMNCPAVNFTPMPATPSILLVLDRSGSMDTDLGGVSRYDAMRAALTGTTGVVQTLQAKAYFGAGLYGCGAATTLINPVPRALNNASAIDMYLNNNSPAGNTPTAEALTEARALFAATPPPAGSPPVIVLATDGEPNSCNGGLSQAQANANSVAAAAAAYAAGIPVYVLAMNQNSQHFQDVANAGQGWQTGQPNITYYPTTNAADLAAAFQTIINGVISCDLSLTATIDDGQAMNGVVVVNGVTLTYGVDWILVNGDTIRVQGGACQQLKNTMNPMVSATFPCGSVIF